jgi:hypothetical protein
VVARTRAGFVFEQLVKAERVAEAIGEFGLKDKTSWLPFEDKGIFGDPMA